MKIYTKTGDDGETGLLGGVRVSKSHLAINACGALDETNSIIGVCRSAIWTERSKLADEVSFDDVDKVLSEIQNDLFDIGSRVASCLGDSRNGSDFPESRSAELEREIDRFQSELPPLTAFILPGGSTSGSTLHLARSVCRRSERDLVSLVQSGIEQPLGRELIYLNRLGDLLFVLARIANLRTQFPETQWTARAEKKPDSND